MSALHLSLLGPFALTIDNRPILHLTSPKIHALVAYLALEAARPHPREALAELLWPERPPGVARQNLRQSLSRLRRALPSGDPPLLIATRQAVRFNTDSGAAVDAVTLLDAIDAGKRHDHSALDRCVDCCTALAQATALYSGDLLHGLDAASPAFDGWLLLKREWLRREVLHALDVLVRHAAGQGDHGRAHDHARRRIEIDPLLEAAHRQLMWALTQLDRRHEALDHYITLHQRLRTELDVEPSVETTRLRDLIKQGSRGAEEQGSVDDTTHSPLPLRSPALQPSSLPNFPPQHSAFVGREKELAAVAARLADPHCRLLTLVGPGGVGKTRLAIEAARARPVDLADGAAFVALAPLASSSQMLTTLAHALDFTFSRRAAALGAQRDELLHWLADQERLLLLDNAEHLLNGDSTLLDLTLALLHRAPRVKLLVTSRTRLHLRAEWIMDVAGLDAPPAAIDPSDEVRYSAVRFFVQSTQRIRPDFALAADNVASVARICRRVEGVPLALELASGWARDFSPAEIAQQIDDSLDFLHTSMRDVPPRHRSLRAIFEQTWRQLSPAQQRLFAQLTVFRGAFTAAAAQQIAGAAEEALREFADCSLLRTTSVAGAWYTKPLRPAVQGSTEQSERHPIYELHETLRQYAAEKLAHSTALQHATQQRHAAYFTALIADEEAALEGAELAEAVARLHGCIDNVRAAWRWAVEYADVTSLARSVHGLLRYFVVTSQSEEGLSTFGGAIDALRQRAQAATLSAEAQTLLADLLAARSRMFFRLARYDEAHVHAREALAAAQRVNAERPAALARLYTAISLMHQGKIDEARDEAERCLDAARAIAWPKIESDALRTLGILSDMRDSLADARRCYEASLAISQRIDDLRGASASLGNLGAISRRQGRFEEAQHHLEQSLQMHRAIGDRSSEGRTLTFLGELAADLEEYERAQLLFAEAQQILLDVGERHYVADALVAAGKAHAQIGQRDAALDRWQQALHIYTAAGERDHAWRVEQLLRDFA